MTFSERKTSMTIRRILVAALACVPLPAGAAPAFGQDRVWWVDSNGSFQRTAGNQWTENRGDGLLCHFVETKRTDAFVELFDKGRNCTLQLFDNHCRIKFGNGKFEKLYDGKWGKAEEKSYSGLTSAELQKVIDKHWDASQKGAWDIVSLKGYAHGAESRYDITWRKMSGPDQNVRYDLTLDAFNAEKKNLAAHGIIVESSWEVNGQRLYAAVWVHRAGKK
jgi:hypothetical protein